MAEEQFQTSKREVRTAVPIDTTEMPIRKIDWIRIYRRVHNIPRRSDFYTTAAGVAWGISAAAFLSLIPLYQSTQNNEPWVRPTYWVIGVAAAIVAMIIHKFAKEREGTIRITCEEVERDMAEVHQTFFPDEDLLNIATPLVSVDDTPLPDLQGARKSTRSATSEVPDIDKIVAHLRDSTPQRGFLRTLIDSATNFRLEGNDFVLIFPQAERSSVETLATQSNRQTILRTVNEIRPLRIRLEFTET